jgi:outer membrane protein assembly factor BamB
VQTTARTLVFCGALPGNLRAFDAATGAVLWEQQLDGPVQNSTITYAANGTQYLAVLTGVGLTTPGLIREAGLEVDSAYNALYVFALP